MKSLIGTLFFLMNYLSFVLAQPVQEFSFSREIKGVEFEKASIMKYVLQPDQARIFLELSRIGAVQTKMGPLWSGGADPMEVKALGIIDLSKDLELISEELIFLEPDGVLSKQQKLLKQPGKVVGNKNVMGTQDDCMSISAIVDKYPELVREEETGGKVLPKEYYDNSIDYGGLAMKVKGFNSRLYRLKPEGGKKSLFAQLTDARYDDIKSTYDWEPYRGGDKQNYWMQLSSSLCDPQTGMVYAHNGLVKRGEDRGRSMEKYQEFVTYDKSGKEISRTEITFDVPHEVALRQTFFTDNPDNGLYSIDGLVHVYRQQYGFGYKKLNPDPDPEYRKLYYWDAQGKALANIDFKVPAEEVRILRGFRNGNALSLLAGNKKEGGWLTYHIAGGQLNGPEKADALGKDIGFTPAELASFSWEQAREMANADGSRTIICHLKKEVKEADKVYNYSQGYVLFNIGADGKIAAAQHLRRSEKARANTQTQLNVYPAEGYFTLLMSDPVAGSNGNMLEVSVLKVNPASLATTPVHSMQGAGEGLSVERVPNSKNLIIFSTDPDGEKYMLTQLSL